MALPVSGGDRHELNQRAVRIAPLNHCRKRESLNFMIYILERGLKGFIADGMGFRNKFLPSEHRAPHKLCNMFMMDWFGIFDVFSVSCLLLVIYYTKLLRRAHMRMIFKG